jgi:alpha-L-fucosidase
MGAGIADIQPGAARMSFSRRTLLKGAAALAGSSVTARLAAATVQPDWPSLVASYRFPDWFRDAKFGIWSHWGPQCVPEFGDWYGRQMYLQGNPYYHHHVKTYGHPADFGFMEIIGRWKAEHWDPDALMALYARAGARYFMSMANHHDNFDNFDSAHHAWNATRVGPKRDIVGTWEKIARKAGMRFAVSNHSGHAWHWWQTAYGYDAEGPRRGERYDAFRLRKRDGRGKWWEGLDPQELYTGPIYAPPPGIDSIAAMNRWHGERDGQWLEHAPPGRPDYTRKWLLRQQDLVEKYRPDMVYFDDHRIPFGHIGLEAVAHFYNKSIEWHGGIDVVLTAKQLSDYQRYGIVADVERAFLADIQPVPWQTDTCIGNWHYDRRLYEEGGYKSARTVVQRLCDVVSKNGNLMLNIPMRGDGSIDSEEEKILAGLATWFAANGVGIYGTRPWRSFGEGPTKPPVGFMAEGEAKPFTAQDIRFTVGGGALYAFFLDWPDGESRIVALGRQALAGVGIETVEMLDGRPVAFHHGDDGLRLTLPRPAAGAFVPGIRIRGRGLI